MTGIAIVGMGCRFPGGVLDPQSYWEFLSQGRCGITEIPADRWALNGFYDPAPDVPGRSYSKWGGFLDNVKGFDPAFFRLSGREAEAMDPQQRLLLTVAYEAVQDARMPISRLRELSTGVFVGLSNADYGHLQRMRAGDSEILAGTGTALSIVANRLSNALDFSGPSLGVDTACSSSLVALDTACRHLEGGSCDVAIVAGVNIILDPRLFATFSQAHMLSPAGKIRTFDASADGFVRSEGIGVVILERDGDAARGDRRVYANIKATAINQDGATGTITAPNADAQRRMMRTVARRAGVAKDEVVYAEAHGTGTVVGDPIEANAIGAVFGGSARREPLFIGSSKPNLGHLEPAAGIAGLMKAALVLHHGRIPPSIGFEEPNPAIHFGSFRLAVNKDMADLPKAVTKPHVLVNSFGFGGTNACAILGQVASVGEGHCTQPTASVPYTDVEGSASAIAVPLSAPTEDHLRAYARLLSDEMADGGQLAKVPVVQIAQALAGQRDHFEQRAAVVASSTQELQAKLVCLADGDTWPKKDPRDPPGILLGRAKSARKLVFTMTGQGGQWWSMGRELLQRHPVFRETVTGFDAIFRRVAGWSVVDVLMSEEANSPIDDAAVTPAVMFAFQTGLAAIWKSVGVTPDIVVGHSFGEVTAAYLAGGLSREVVANLVNQRGLIRGQVDRRGTMAAIGLSAKDVGRYLPADGSVEIGGYNAPHLVTLTGDETAIDSLIAKIHEDDPTKLARKLSLDFAYHSSWFEPVEDQFLADVGEIEAARPGIPVISTVTGETNTSFGADYWWRNLRYPVQYQSAIETALEMGGDIFIELGPHRTLSSMTAGCAAEQGRSVVAISTLYRQWNDFISIGTAIGELYVSGYDIDWQGAFGPAAAARIDLPRQPWIYQDYWIEPEEVTQVLRPEVWHPLLGMRGPMPGAQWSNELSLSRHRYIGDHTIAGSVVFPASAYLEMMVTAAREVFKSDKIELRDVVFTETLYIDGPDEIQLRTLFNSDRGRIEIHSRRRNVDADWSLNARCLARARDVRLPPTFEPVQLSPLNVERFYSKVRRAGYEYGSAFQCLERIEVGDQCATGQACSIGNSVPGSDRWLLDPCMLDSCLQLMLALGGDEDDEKTDLCLCLPVSIDRVLLVGDPGPGLEASLLRSLDPGARGEVYRLEIGGKGEDRCLVLDGIRTRQLTPGDEITAGGRFAVETYRQIDERSRIAPDRAATTILLFGDKSATETRSLEAAYREAGAAVRVENVAGVEASELFRQSVEDWRADNSTGLIVYAASIAGNSIDSDQQHCRTWKEIIRQTARLVAFGQALSALGDRLAGIPVVIVSHKARSVEVASAHVPPDLAHATLAAVARTIALECPTLDVRIADCDYSGLESAAALVDWLSGPSREREVVLSKGQAWVPRLEERTARELRPRHLPTSELRPDKTFVIEQDRKGQRDAFVWRSTPRLEIGAHQIAVRCEAVGLNFRDVMAVNGMLPPEAEKDDAGRALGLEFAGTVSDVAPGEQVFAVGQRVFGVLRGALRGKIVVDRRCVFPTPEKFSNEQAATLSSAYLTAQYSLITIGRLEAGQTVLVHSGAGGLGLAAIHIAQAVGARVIATAGTEHKRAYLRDLGVDLVLPSRSLDFVDRVATATDGRGVDVVLNALPGEFIAAGLECLAPYGQFLELGKRDVYGDRSIGLKAMRRNISFHVVDIAALIEDRPGVIQRLMTELLRQLGTGELPALPVGSFKASQIDDAFRHFASGKHVGRIAIDLTEPELAVEADKDAVISRHGSVLITGGSSGMGHAIARALARGGAGRIVLASRHQHDEQSLKVLKSAVAETGCLVEAIQLDVTDAVATSHRIKTLAKSDLPLNGIIHAAVHYDDALLAQMSTDRINAVAAPKIKGVMNLSNAVLAAGCKLDFLVSFGSMAQVTGWPAQANYAAANAFLEAFVPWQRRRGIPAQCINWGVFSQSGQVARNDRLASYMANSGWVGLDDEAVAARLFEMIASDEPVASIYDADWSKVFQSHRPLASSARLGGLRDVHGDRPGSSARVGLGELDDDQRYCEVEQLIRQAVGQVLRSDPGSFAHCHVLADTGIDSLSMFELRVQLERELGLDVPLARFVKAATVADLTELVCELIAN